MNTYRDRSNAQACGAQVASEASTQPQYQQIKLALDVHAASILVVRMVDGANPQPVGGYDTSGSARGVAVSGNYAYVADAYWGLLILGPRTPRITSLNLAAGTATVYFTSTIPGTNYTLEYRTNLTAGNWEPVGTQPAPGYSAFQTDTSAGPAPRYYRVSCLP